MTQIVTKRGNTHDSGIFTLHKHMSRLEIGLLKVHMEQLLKKPNIIIKTGKQVWNVAYGYVDEELLYINKPPSDKLYAMMRRASSGHGLLNSPSIPIKRIVGYAISRHGAQRLILLKRKRDRRGELQPYHRTSPY